MGDFLCDGAARLPKMEAGIRDTDQGIQGVWQGPSAWCVDTSDIGFAEATTGRVEVQDGIFNAQAEGPSARARALCGEGGIGAFAEASLGRAEANLGPLGLRLEPNVNTGIGVQNGNVEANLLGFGFAVGQDGGRLNTPVGGLNCTVM